MGIDNKYAMEYFYTTYGTDETNRYYIPHAPTGCAAYYEDGYPAGTWRLPTAGELVELYYDIITVFELWNLTEDKSSSNEVPASGPGYFLADYGGYSNLKDKSAHEPARCVRENADINYTVSSSHTSGSDFYEKGEAVTVTATGFFPSLTIRAYDGSNELSTATLYGHYGMNSVDIDIPSNLSGSDRTVYLQYHDGTTWQTLTWGKQEAYIIAEKFAKSNIIMKADGTLAFATNQEENLTVAPANSQGIHFKFGSLIGVFTATGDYNFDASEVVFVPAEYTGSTAWATWYTIPFYETPYHGVDDEFITEYDESSPTPGYDAAAGIGDICRYISDKGWVQGRWRTPTAWEWMDLIENSVFVSATGTWNQQTVINNPAGTYGTGTIDSGWWLGSNVTTSITAPPNTTIFTPANAVYEGGYGWVYGEPGVHGSLLSTTCTGSGDTEEVVGFDMESNYVTVQMAHYKLRAEGVRCIQE